MTEWFLVLLITISFHGGPLNTKQLFSSSDNPRHDLSLLCHWILCSLRSAHLPDVNIQLNETNLKYLYFSSNDI